MSAVRRFFGSVLILFILASALTVGVCAAPDTLLIAPAPSADSVQREGYIDVPADHWAMDAIERYTDLGALQGNPDGSFEPDAYMTCAQLASFISRAFRFADAELSVLDGYEGVDKDAWYAQSLANCVSAGIIGCDADTPVAPGDFVTREQAVVMLCRVYEIEPLNNVTPNYIDAFDISTWAAPYIAALTRAGILKGYPDKTFKAQGFLSRAESVHLAAEIVDSMIDSGTYAMAVRLDRVANGRVTVGNIANNITAFSGITAELCYMADNGEAMLNLFDDPELIADVAAAADVFYAGGIAWHRYGEQISDSLTGDEEFVEAFVTNARVSELDVGREYKLVIKTRLCEYDLTVTVTLK